MNIGEIYEVMYALVEISDGLFEQWVTITFATLIAVTIGSKFLDKILQVFVSILYLCVSTYLALRFVFIGERLALLRDKLVEQGEPYEVGVLSYSWSFAMAVFFIGIVGTLYMVWRRRPEGDT